MNLVWPNCFEVSRWSASVLSKADATLSFRPVRTLSVRSWTQSKPCVLVLDLAF
jgi:hypothetical protein